MRGMRDIFEEIYDKNPIDPTEAARKSLRPAQLRRRFYAAAGTGDETAGGYPIQLDGRPIRTPARAPLAVPTRALAGSLAAEWDAQREVIDPAQMPLTRLANSIIDGVADKRGEVAADIAKYLGSDLLFYRADGPPGLVAEEGRLWDPVLDWAREALGARFVLAEGVVFAGQPSHAIDAARRAIPQDVWRLGAAHAVTTLTGSALLALALAHRRMSAAEVWTAAHVDEDWNIQQWGRDELALERRDKAWTEMQAAATVLDALG